MGKGNTEVSLSCVDFDMASKYLQGHARDTGGILVEVRRNTGFIYLYRDISWNFVRWWKYEEGE